jgi:hypothetical protein
MEPVKINQSVGRLVKGLPSGFHAIGTLDLTKNVRALIWMNVVGLLLFIFFAFLFIQALVWMRPADALVGLSINIQGVLGVFSFFAVLVLIYAVAIILHEGVHGVFLAWYTRSRPSFAFHWYYACASAPGWYFPRNLYYVVSLAPLVILSLLGFLVLALAPVSWLLPVLVFMVINASGAVGDLFVFIWLARQPGTCLAYDTGNAVTLYLPESLP